MLVIGSRLPNRQWLVRFLILSVLWASAVFPLLFFAAYHLPGGVAAVINSLGPICVMVVAVPILGTAIRRVQLIAGALGVVGVALLVLRSNAKLDVLGHPGHGRRGDHDGVRDRADEALGQPARHGTRSG